MRTFGDLLTAKFLKMEVLGNILILTMIHVYTSNKDEEDNDYEGEIDMDDCN